MLTKYLTVLVILVQSVHSISTPTTTISSHLYSTQKCDESQYTMYYLALTSVGSFCDQNKCDANRLKNRNINLLTIHGFWPSTQDRTFFSCMKQYQYDPFCYNNYKFNLSTFTAKEQQEMNRYWPKLTGRDTWSHEWSKHGSCYMHIMKHYFNSTKPNSQIVKDYFLGSVQKAKSLNISLPKGQYATKQRLSKVINLHPNYFQVICHDDNIVQQIKVCYDLSDVPRKQELVQCPVSKNRDICRFPIKVI